MWPGAAGILATSLITLGLVLGAAAGLVGCLELGIRPTATPAIAISAATAEAGTAGPTAKAGGAAALVSPRSTLTLGAGATTESAPAGQTVVTAQTADVRPTPTQSPDGTNARDAVANAVEMLDRAGSFRFTMVLQHRVVIENAEHVFTYNGRGSASDQGKFVSILEGTSDAFFYVEIDGETRTCLDSRGAVNPCSPIRGGPRSAISPFALIEYLRVLDSVEPGPGSGAQVASRTYRYAPSIIRLTLIGDQHKQAMDQVVKVEGVVAIHATTGLPISQSVEVVLRTPAGQEHISATMQFEGFGEPFSPEAFRPGPG